MTDTTETKPGALALAIASELCSEVEDPIAEADVASVVDARLRPLVEALERICEYPDGRPKGWGAHSRKDHQAACTALAQYRGA